MYALAASGNHRKKRSAKIAKKKLPKRRRKAQIKIKERQRKILKKHAKKRYKKSKPKIKKRQKAKPGLTKAERAAKEWVSWHESRDRWNVVGSVGCYGRYQLTPAYLHGDYSHTNQSRTADRYIKNRYGSWIQAKHFWQVHNWY